MIEYDAEQEEIRVIETITEPPSTVPPRWGAWGTNKHSYPFRLVACSSPIREINPSSASQL